MSSLPGPVRRREFPRFARILGVGFARCILLPVTWLLRLVRVWPRRVIRSINERMERESASFAPTQHDVVVASFFKSGTNWTMQTALQIAWRGGADFEHIHDLVPWLEWPQHRLSFCVPITDELWQFSPTQLRVIKTHLPIGKIEYNRFGRYVWVVRDPKSVFVSSYYFLRSLIFGPLMPSLEEWLDIFLSEDSFNGSWAVHLNSGWQLRHKPNVLFITYEDMQRDRQAAIDTIASLMGIQLTSAERAQVIERSSYEYMKANGQKFDTLGIAPPWANARGTMVRRGTAGGSAELLTPDQQRRIDDYWRAQLQLLGSDFPYDQHFGAAVA